MSIKKFQQFQFQFQGQTISYETLSSNLQSLFLVKVENCSMFICHFTIEEMKTAMAFLFAQQIQVFNFCVHILDHK